MQLQGNAYISGAASGIGKATAICLAKHGVQGLAIADLNMDGLTETKKEIELVAPNAQVLTILLDVSQPESVFQAVNKSINHFERIHYVANNAGIAGTHLGGSATLDRDALMRVLDVNLIGLWNTQKEFIKHFLNQEPIPEGEFSETRGTIVNTASIAGLGAFGSTAYITSKHGVVGLTKADAVHHAKDKIRINSICPGTTHTPMVEQFYRNNDQGILQRIPMQRMGNPGEIANVINFLLSPLSSYITGAAIVVDGGKSIS
ncbi:oxidoreductase [Phaeosphaeriaceae sp. PMI808]|nr:oxidoreductase [Phaeosphaeriaceae sp. PMI808]